MTDLELTSRPQATAPGGLDAERLRHDLLWREFQRSRSAQARERLILTFIPVAHEVAVSVKRRLPASVELADLVSDGYLGLIDAVERFDPRRGPAFSAYAVTRIRGAIIDGLRAADWVPRSVRSSLREIGTATAVLEQRHGRPVRESEIAAELDISTPRLQALRSQLSGSRLVGLETDAEPLSPTLDWADGPRLERAEALRVAVRALPDRERHVVALSYWGRLTLAEIGQALDISESRVSQLRSRARAALRRAMEPGTERASNRG